MNDPNELNRPRSLSYTEMMNEGRQKLDVDDVERQYDFERRVEVLEQKVQYLEKIIQRQLRLGRMND